MKIVLDGNIGCGKSSIINKITETNYFNLPVFNEPLNNWDKWLELFYSNMNKYSFGFQMRVLKSHLDNKVITKGIFERSPLSCQRVFGEILFEDKMMTKLEWDLTEEFFNDYGWIPDLIIYLRCDPETCFSRINQRNRNSEENIRMEYLERLYNKYEKLYNSSELGHKYIKVIQVDATQSIDVVFDEIIDKVNSFMNN